MSLRFASLDTFRLACIALTLIAAPVVVRGDDGADPDPEVVKLTNDIELDDANFAAWHQHIAPTREELGWKLIGWLPTFTDGLVAADAQRMPLLLWVMNGHPLGCT